MTEKLFKPANKSTLHDDVLAQMTDAILKGVWLPGSRLPGEQALADQFQVSRNCIREVLKALALSGVVEARPGSGTFLSFNALRYLNNNKLINTMLDEASLRECMEVRCLIEGQIAFLVAEKATEAQIAELEKILKRRSPTPIDDHACFHDALGKIAGNQLLNRFLESVRNELEISRQRFREWGMDTQEEYTCQHLKIFEYIKARDPEGSRKAMIEHIVDAWSVLSAEDEVFLSAKNCEQPPQVILRAVKTKKQKTHHNA